ncbi:hypothetical protein GCM10020256_02390 [Streptomyces thermocoprophilus]
MRLGTPSGACAPSGSVSAWPSLPMTKVTTARGVSRQAGGRGPSSWAARKASSAAWRSSGGTICRAGAGVGVVVVIGAGSSGLVRAVVFDGVGRGAGAPPDGPGGPGGCRVVRVPVTGGGPSGWRAS